MGGKLLIVGLVFGLTETFIVASQPILFQLAQPLTEASATMISTTSSGLSIIIDPVLVFIVMYYFGTGIDLSVDYLGSFLALFLGVLVGTTVSFLSVAAYLFFYAPTIISLSSFLGNGVFFYGVGSFRLSLVGFAGLAFAYLSRRRSVGPGPIPP